MISSVYPQDTYLYNFLKKCHTFGNQLWVETEEKRFVGSIRQLEESSNEPLVQFLHLLLNNLCQLLVRPTVTQESGTNIYNVLDLYYI